MTIEAVTWDFGGVLTTSLAPFGPGLGLIALHSKHSIAD
jgi:hypothetical protein